MHTGKFMHKLNSQVQNTPTIFFSLGTTRQLYFDRRYINISKGGNKWSIDPHWKTSYSLSSDTISIIHPDDENPNNSLPLPELYQYRHGVSKVANDDFSLGIGLRIVSNAEKYDVDTSILHHEKSEKDPDYTKEYHRFSMHRRDVHKKLLKKFHDKVDKLI